MRTPIIPIRAWLTAIAATFQMAAAAAATLPAAGCSPAAAHASVFAPLPASAAGYHVTSVHWDPVLKQRWAVVSSCDHPERPSVTVPVVDASLPRAAQQSLFPVVRSGDVVRLVSSEPQLRVTISAIAEENGAVGGKVHVRLLRPIAGSEDASNYAAPPVILLAVVRGPHEVEVER